MGLNASPGEAVQLATLFRGQHVGSSAFAQLTRLAILLILVMGSVATPGDMLPNGFVRADSGPGNGEGCGVFASPSCLWEAMRPAGADTNCGAEEAGDNVGVDNCGGGV